MNARLLTILSLALALRLGGVFWADEEVVDVLRYRKVADHILDVSWNPYQAPRLYPYPPVWVWVEAGCGWLARHTALRFPILVKLPVVIADVLIVALFVRARWRRAAWIYACHPVSLLVTGFHGQFDALALLFVLTALRCHETGRNDAAALALSAAIGLKSFPALLLPPFLLSLPGGGRARLRFALLAALPVAALLAPYAVHDLSALRRELLAYGGVADFGWIALIRGMTWAGTGRLLKSQAEFWAAATLAAKAVFLLAYGAILALLLKRRLRWTSREWCLGIFLAFLSLYGALSAQYLLWAVPVGLLVSGRFSFLYGITASVALVGFYCFLAPGILSLRSTELLPRELAGVVWVAGVGAVWVTSLAWLVTLLRRGLRRDSGSANR